jgi:two-component response regulator (ARR-A family)
MEVSYLFPCLFVFIDFCRFFMIGSCLEEGAEEFLLKPVKLSDVKRLTDFIMSGEGKKVGGKRSQKRNRSDDCISSLSTVSHPCDLSSLSPSAMSSKKI